MTMIWILFLLCFELRNALYRILVYSRILQLRMRSIISRAINFLIVWDYCLKKKKTEFRSVFFFFFKYIEF